MIYLMFWVWCIIKSGTIWSLYYNYESLTLFLPPFLPLSLCLSPSFPADHVFSSSVETDEIYDSLAKPIILSVMEGFNGMFTLFTQTLNPPLC